MEEELGLKCGFFECKYFDFYFSVLKNNDNNSMIYMIELISYFIYMVKRFILNNYLVTKVKVI